MKGDLESVQQIKTTLERYEKEFERVGGNALKRYWGRLLEAQRVHGLFKQRYVVEEGDDGE
eukprot:3085221-Rhodomonas_salina.1